MKKLVKPKPLADLTALERPLWAAAYLDRRIHESYNYFGTDPETLRWQSVHASIEAANAMIKELRAVPACTYCHDTGLPINPLGDVVGRCSCGAAALKNQSR